MYHQKKFLERITGYWMKFNKTSSESNCTVALISHIAHCNESNCTIALISHASKVMLKILQARLQQYVNHELSDD